jgi:glycosyltransferase involved in cell wall biosynthesis
LQQVPAVVQKSNGLKLLIALFRIKMYRQRLEDDIWPSRPSNSKRASASINKATLYASLLIELAKRAMLPIIEKANSFLYVSHLRLASFKYSARLALRRIREISLKIYRHAYYTYEAARQDVYARHITKELYDPIRINANKPIISVVIPCFNYGQFLLEAIESVLSQTVSNIEIIVVDGGSTDSYTLDVLSSLKHERVKVHLRKGRHLVGDNRNYGISRSQGRYVCCLDADDTLSPTYLEKAIFLLESYAYDCVSTSVSFFGSRSGGYGVLEYPTLASMIEGNHITTCAVFRKVLWHEVGGYRDTGIGLEHLPEDWDFWLRIAAHGARFRNLSREPLFNYRQHMSGSLSTTDVSPLSEQRAALLNRNAILLTKKNKSLSNSQSSRVIVSRHPGGALTEEMQCQIKSDQQCLFICLPYLTAGGAERLLATYSQRLSEIGWRIVIITTNPAPEGSATSEQWFRTTTNEIYQLEKTYPRCDWDGFLDYLLDSRKPQYILLAGSAYMYDRLEHIKQKKHEVTIVDFIFNEIGHTRSNLRFRSYIDSVLCETEVVRDWLITNNGWGQEDIAIIRSSVNTELYLPREKDMIFFEKTGIPSDKFIVGYSGRMSHEKGPDLVLEIARRCQSSRRIHFVMTGSGPLSTAIADDIQDSGLNNITFLGHVPNISYVMANFDALLLPSRIDGRPMVVLEALSMGKPVVASCLGGLPELIDNSFNGYLCEPGNCLEFSQCLIRLSEDVQVFQSLKRNARQYAVSNFSLAKSTETLISALER